MRSLLRAVLRGSSWRTARHQPAPRLVPAVALLEDRDVPAVTAVCAGDALAVFGDNLDHTIILSRNATGSILVNGGAVRVLGDTPTVTNTFVITVFDEGGADVLTVRTAVDETARAVAVAVRERAWKAR